MFCVDLCSGLGGFSEAFVVRGHDVIRIDNDPKFKKVPNTIIGDIRDIKSIIRQKPHLTIKSPDVLLMSPPCNRFSIASCHHHWTKQGEPKHKGTIDSMRIVFWCLDAVDYLNPKYWILENPRGMLRKILGKPSITTFFASWGELHYKPTDLWGKIPPKIQFPKPVNWEKAPRGSIGKGSERLNNSEDRAKIPYKLSESLCIAIEKELGVDK